MSINNFFKNQQKEKLKQADLEKQQKQEKLDYIRKVKSVQFKARVAHRVEQFQESKLNDLKQTLQEGTYPILPLTKHSFRDRYKEKEINGNITIKNFLTAKDRARQTMAEFQQGHLAPGEFNPDQPHKNHQKWLKQEDTSQQGQPMRYGLGQRFETERVKKIIEHNSQKVDYVKKDLKMLVNPTWKSEDISKWMDKQTFNIYNKQRYDPSSWNPLPINCDNQNNVFVDGFENLGDPSRKRYKELEHKRSEFIPTIKEDQIGTTLHISRSLRAFQADQLLHEDSKFDQFSQNKKLNFYKTALVETKSVDHLTPHQHSNNFKSMDFKNLRPDSKVKIFRQSLTQSTNAHTVQIVNITPQKTGIKFDTEQATTADHLQTRLSNIQEVSQNLINIDPKIQKTQLSKETENSKSKSQFFKQQSFDKLIKLKYPYHQENDEVTKTKVGEYFKWQ